MAYTTHGLVSADAELEIRQKHLDGREKQLRKQHKSF